MTTISDEELRQRLAGIAQGPWADRLDEARRKLAPVGKIRPSLTRTPLIELDKISLSTADKQKSRRLSRILRPHWEDKHGVTDPREIATRDALDDALTLPQLYELAVQTGYLPAESVRHPARKILTDLLWSPAARGFVVAYDYVVPMLASRVAVSGLGNVQPPEPNPNAALRFAGFLAHLRAFYAEEQIEIWTRFLDDFIAEEDEQDKLWRYLNGERKTAPERAETLLLGCKLFVTSLASAFRVLDEDDLGRFGLIHAYWLQKFFGYEMGDGGYVKNVALWGKTDSWAHTVATSSHLVEAGTDSKIAKVNIQQFSEQVKLLEQAFEAVRLLVKTARQNANLTVPLWKLNPDSAVENFKVKD